MRSEDGLSLGGFHKGMGPEPLAIEDDFVRWTAADLEACIAATAEALRRARVARLATLMDNSAAWVVVDRACAAAGIVHVPLPSFFVPAQMLHAASVAGVDAWLGAIGSPPFAGFHEAGERLEVAGHALGLCRRTLPVAAAPLPAGTRKVTFTSGTTGAPKGVCLDEDGPLRVARGLAERLAPLGIRRHLCVLPLPVLLENIAGVLAPRLAGATCVVPSLRRLGLAGSSAFEAAVFDDAVRATAPDSLVLMPQMLRAWTAHLRRVGRHAVVGLKFVAVGGAAVGPKLLAAARAAGIPAYEGYGLSEAASVQTLNLPGDDRRGSVGRPLPHARLRVAADGEIEVAGSLFLGYAGEAATSPVEWWPTGDVGSIDPDGYVFLQGRKRHVLITGFGRNVAPEWVESALRDEPPILQAVVFGEAEPQLRAVLWPTDPQSDDDTLARAVSAANATLPDYARVGRWVRAEAPFNAASGMATSNGRPRRDAIRLLHAHLPGAGLPEFLRPAGSHPTSPIHSS